MQLPSSSQLPLPMLTSAANPQQKPAKAKPPFDASNADVILRARDLVDFYVHKVILSLASPVFADMFSLTQPHENSADGHRRPTPAEHLPVIHMSETSQTLDHLLRLCYPVTYPVLTAPSDLTDVLGAAMKYSMEAALEALERSNFEDLLKSHPLQLYAIALRLKSERLARNAAIEWRMVVLSGSRSSIRHGETGKAIAQETEVLAQKVYGDDIAHISAGAYFRLISYVRSGDTETLREPTSTICSTSDPQIDLRSLPEVSPPPSFPTADIILRSADGTVFHVHRIILTMASSVLDDLIAEPSQRSTISEASGLRVVDLPEHSKTLQVLLQLLYSMDDPLTIAMDLNGVVLFANAAAKYKITSAMALSKHYFQKHIAMDPLRTYFIAVQFGWLAEARQAAVLVARRSIADHYTPEMEQAEASMYYRLLRFSQAYRTSFFDVIHSLGRRSDISWSQAQSMFDDSETVPCGVYSPEALFASIAFLDSNHRAKKSSVITHVQDMFQYSRQMEEALAKVELDIPAS